MAAAAIWIDPLAKWWHVGGSQAWHGAALSPKRLLLVVQRAASAFSGRTWRPTARERALRGTSGRPAGRACFCAGWYAIPPHPAVTSSSADAGIGRPLGIKCLTSLSTPLCRPLTTGFLLLNFHAGPGTASPHFGLGHASNAFCVPPGADAARDVLLILLWQLVTLPSCREHACRH